MLAVVVKVPDSHQDISNHHFDSTLTTVSHKVEIWLLLYMLLIHWFLGDGCGNNFKSMILKLGHSLSDECYRNSLMKSQHWFRLWLGAIRQQAITLANVDPHLCCHMSSIGHTELIRLCSIELGRLATHWLLYYCYVHLLTMMLIYGYYVFSSQNQSICSKIQFNLE